MTEEKPFISTDMANVNSVFADRQPQGGENSDDKLRGIFNNSDGIKIVGDESDDIPSELVELLGNLGLGDAGAREGKSRSAFRVMLKEITPESKGEPAYGRYLNQYRMREIPTVQHIADTYGSGDYCYQVQYTERNVETGKRQTKYAYVHFSVSDKVEPDRKRKAREAKIEHIQKLKQKLREAEEDEYIEDQLGFAKTKENIDPAAAGRAYLESIVEANKALGLTPGGRGGTDWGELITKALGMVAPALPALLQMVNSARQKERERFENLMMMMISTKDQSHSQMIELLQKQSSGSNNIMEAMDMVARMVDFKKEISEEKESIVDKIMGMIEAAGPMLAPLLAMPKQMRAANPMYQHAQTIMEKSPEIQAVKNEPELLAHMTRKLDEKFGPNSPKTDAILEAAGVKRPVSSSNKNTGADGNDLNNAQSEYMDAESAEYDESEDNENAE